MQEATQTAIEDVQINGLEAEQQSKNVLKKEARQPKNWLKWIDGEWCEDEIEHCRNEALIKMIGCVISVFDEADDFPIFEKNELIGDLKQFCDYAHYNEKVNIEWIGRIFRTMGAMYRCQMLKKGKEMSSTTANLTIKRFMSRLTRQTPRFYKLMKDDIFAGDKYDLLHDTLKNVPEISQMQSIYYESRKFLGTDLGHLFMNCWAHGIIPDSEFVKLKTLFQGGIKNVVQLMFNSSNKNGKSLQLITVCTIAALAQLMEFLSDGENCKKIRMEEQKTDVPATKPNKSKKKKVDVE
jgi:hypothetical protein